MSEEQRRQAKDIMQFMTGNVNRMQTHSNRTLLDINDIHQTDCVLWLQKLSIYRSSRRKATYIQNGVIYDHTGSAEIGRDTTRFNSHKITIHENPSTTSLFQITQVVWTCLIHMDHKRTNFK